MMLGRFLRKDKGINNKEKPKLTFLKDKSTHASILSYFGFNDFNHETYFTDFVAENNANLCINGGYVLIKLGNAFISFGKSLKDPNKKVLKKQNKINKLQNKLNSINKQPEIKSIY